jgi:hypothetical protein
MQERADVVRPRVLYVGGAGRSGSTVLGRVAGQVPGFVHVGELVFIWRRGVLDNQLCGCGEPFLDCPFWRAVGERAFGGWVAQDASDAEELRSHVERTRHIPALISPVVPAGFRRDLAHYTARLAQLYRAVTEVSGSDVIVETSKGPSHALLLRRIGELDVRVCLLVRDSRGVGYSWTRRKRRPEINDAEAYMDNYSTTRAATEWTSFNAAFSCGPMLGLPTLRMRYEDFVEAPEREVARLVEFAAVDPVALPDIFGDGTVRLASDHSVAGNPGRFAVGDVTLVADDEWRQAMPAGQRRLMTALTAPWLLRYGYLRSADSESQPKSRPR